MRGIGGGGAASGRLTGAWERRAQELGRLSLAPVHPHVAADASEDRDRDERGNDGHELREDRVEAHQREERDARLDRPVTQAAKL